jgi:hypothetical protein
LNLKSVLSIAVLLAAVPAIHAETIGTVSGDLTVADPSQVGRLSRNGTPQTWSGQEPYPGALDTATLFNYETFVFAASDFVGAPYVEITLEGSGTSSDNDLFTSAYSGSYLGPIATGWLGDAGSSGSDQTFDVVLPVGANLVVVVNDVTTAGLNDPFQITVTAFADTDRDDPPTGTTAVTPEPGTIFTLGTGLLGLGGILRRRIDGSH